MRVFFAIEVPGDLQQELAIFAGSLEGDLRRVRPEQIHLTLRFVGEVPDDAVPALIDAARPAIDGPSFTLRVHGGGVYGSKTRPRALWAATRGEVQRVITIVRGLERAVRSLGYAPSERKFTPHVTLARVTGRVPQSTLERVTRGGPSGDLEVTEITLFRSELLPGGARHTAVERFGLGRRR